MDKDNKNEERKVEETAANRDGILQPRVRPTTPPVAIVVPQQPAEVKPDTDAVPSNPIPAGYEDELVQHIDGIDLEDLYESGDEEEDLGQEHDLQWEVQEYRDHRPRCHRH